MSDHTDFIAIHGLQSSATEVFQGLGGAALTVEGAAGAVGGAAGMLQGLDLSALSDLFTESAFYELWDMLDAENVQETAERGIGRSRSIGALIPIGGKLAGLFGALTKYLGPTALALFIQIVNKIGSVIIEEMDPGSPRNQVQSINERLKEIRDHLKKGLIWEDGILGIDKSIIGTALLNEEHESYIEDLQQGINDLSLVDATIEAGNDLKVRWLMIH